LTSFIRMMISTIILWLIFDKTGVNLEVRYACMTILLFGWILGAEIGKIGDLSWKILREIRVDFGAENKENEKESVEG